MLEAEQEELLRAVRETADVQLIETADRLEHTIATLPLPDPDGWEAHLTLAAVLGMAADRFPEQGLFLDRALAAVRRAAAMPGPDAAADARAGAILAALEYKVYERTGDAAYLDRSLGAALTALDATPTSDPGRSAAAHHLENLHRQRHGQIGATADDAAAQRLATQEARAASPIGDTLSAGTEPVPGSTLSPTTNTTLEVAAPPDTPSSASQNAAPSPAPPSLRRLAPVDANDLAHQMRRDFRRTRDLALLHQAIDVLEAALPLARPNEVPYLNSTLAKVRVEMGQATQDTAQFDLAIAHFSAALGENDAGDGVGRHDSTGARTTPGVGPRFRPDAIQAADQADRGVAWVSRFNVSGIEADFDRGVADADAAYLLMPPTQQSAAGLGLYLADRLRERYVRRHDPADLHRAVEVLRESAQRPTGPARTRAYAAWRWGTTESLSGSARAAVDGYATALDLLDLVSWRGLPPADRELLLADFAGLAREAAAAALAASLPETAVELLEQGRAIMLAQLLDDRSGHEELREQHPDLADRLARLTDLLEAPDPLGDAGPARAAAARERDEVLARIRELPDRSGFLRRRPIAELRPSPGDAPVIVVNVAPRRSDALIVTADAVRMVPLAADLAEQTARWSERFAPVVAELDKTPVTSARALLTELLDWLYKTVCRPALTGLAQMQGASKAAGAADTANAELVHVCWCPTGTLALFPLHAAERAQADPHAETPAPTGPTDSPLSSDAPESPAWLAALDKSGSVLETCISSYTPSLRILREARAQPADDTAPTLLRVAPDAPGAGPLPATALESVVDGVPITELLDAAASAERFLAELPAHAWLHYSGHGAQNLEAPGTGRLELHDRPVSVRELRTLRLPQARLAMLTACQSALGGRALADEALTLAAAVQTAGFRHVIGTLWPVRDPVAWRLADGFFELLPTAASSADTAAAVLRTVSLRLRERFRIDPYSWAVFIHQGPSTATLSGRRRHCA